jgi:hypothetical protein
MYLGFQFGSWFFMWIKSNKMYLEWECTGQEEKNVGLVGPTIFTIFIGLFYIGFRLDECVSIVTPP